MENEKLRSIIKSKESRENIESIIVSQIEQYQDGVIIFGCSSTGKLILEELEKLSIRPLCFCDDVEIEEIKEYQGYRLLSSSQAGEIYKGKNVGIILSVNHIDQFNMVKKQLNDLGFLEFIDKDLILFSHKQRMLKQLNVVQTEDVEYKNDGHDIVFDKIEFNITAKCTLKCRDCCQILYLTNGLGHSDVELTNRTINEFSKTVDYCALVEVFGGEPLLHPDLCKILDETSKIWNVLEVVVDTNGTLVPKEDLLKLMASRRIAMRVTDYGELSAKKYLIKEACEKAGVPCTIKKVSTWNIYGKAEKSSYTDQERKFRTCVSANKCSSLIEGKWHVCARNAHLTRLGMLRENENEYMNFMDEDMSYEQKRIKMNGLLLRKEPLSSCMYCDGSDNLSMGGIQF